MKDELASVETDNRRRAFCRSAVRWLAVAGLGGLSGTLMLRDGDGRCSQAQDCRGCAALARCTRPEASAARQPGEVR